MTDIDKFTHRAEYDVWLENNVNPLYVSGRLKNPYADEHFTTQLLDRVICFGCRVYVDTWTAPKQTRIKCSETSRVLHVLVREDML